jgi:thiamine kinase-like enzyme
MTGEDMDLSEETNDAARVAAALAAVPGWADGAATVEAAIPVLASPSWRGADAAPLRVRAEGGETLFVKLMAPDGRATIDFDCAFAAAVAAGAAGLGPQVLFADAEAGVLVMEDLTDGWRTATLEAMYDAATLDRVVETRRAFQALPALPRTEGVFTEIERFYAGCLENAAAIPSDTEWMVDSLRLAAEAIASHAGAPVPIHGDGNVSNIMLHESGAVRLVDFDRATNADPLEDLGSFLIEAHAFEPEARDTFRRLTGGFDEAAFNRAWLYGIADDLRWGLLGCLTAAVSPRKTMEFHKYASWRFVRCRIGVRETRFAERLRRV